jgi:hypothetical protein
MQTRLVPTVCEVAGFIQKQSIKSGRTDDETERLDNDPEQCDSNSGSYTAAQ